MGDLYVDGSRLRIVAPGPATLQAGDELLQLNGHLLRDCAELKAALTEARERKLTALLLVERDGATETVVLSLEDGGEASDQSVTQAELLEPEPPVVPTVAIAEMEAAEADVVRQMARELVELGRELQGRLPLLTAQPWVKRIDDVRDVYAARKEQVPAVAVAEDVVASYGTVGEILVYKEELARETGQRSLQPGSTLEFTSDSLVGGWLRRHPYLAPSVVQAPSEIPILARGERAGRWLPDTAVQLLLEHGVAAGVALESASVR